MKQVEERRKITEEVGGKREREKAEGNGRMRRRRQAKWEREGRMERRVEQETEN